MSDLKSRRAIIAACLAMEVKGINRGTSGNVSVRQSEGMLITPSALPYDQTTPEDIVWMGFDESVVGKRKPSSEWRFHLDILRDRSDITAVVHAHPPACTALAIMHRAIPAIHYMIAAAGGPDIRCAPYATYGTAELSAHALTAPEEPRRLPVGASRRDLPGQVAGPCPVAGRRGRGAGAAVPRLPEDRRAAGSARRGGRARSSEIRELRLRRREGRLR